MRSNFIPLSVGKLFKVTGTNSTGDPILDDGVSVGFSAVRSERVVQQTSVRTDKSGSNASAEEVVYIYRILVEPKANPEEGDIMEIEGRLMRIESSWPRRSMSRLLVHHQVDLIKWLG